MSFGVQIQAVLESKKWTFAKTMPQNPHFWSLKTDWEDQSEFEATENYIFENGVEKMFYRKAYTVLYLNGFRYWTVRGWDLINRAVIDKTDPPEYRGDS
tara:strand:- start:332 stop:628 length:297 start_codon:yes stop_codon:yes gene_type:complete